MLLYASRPCHLTFDLSLTRRCGQAEVVPSPCRHGRKGAEGLETRDIGTKGEVAVAYLQRRLRGAGITARVEGLDDLLPVDFGLDEAAEQR